MLQRKKPLARKTALGAGKAGRAKSREAARQLWALLQQRPGPPFQAGVRLGPYVADFYNPAARLVILLDPAADAADWFAAQGFRLLALPATALRQPERVLDDVAEIFRPRAL